MPETLGSRKDEPTLPLVVAGARSVEELRRARRLCFFAHYHPLGIVAEHVVLYLRALAAAGFDVVVQSTADLAPEEQARLSAECTMLVMRANTGLDFGGWIEAVQRFFPIEAEFLLLTNDSVYAPVGDLSAFIDRLTGVPADFYGAVENFEFDRHLQSWFLLLRPAAYRSPAFLDLMSHPIPAELSKVEIIENYEVGLTRRLVESGLTCHAAYSPLNQGRIGRQGDLNASHLLWRELIERTGLPFLKIQLLRDNPFGVNNLADWAQVIGRRSPALRDAIADDLAKRRAATGVGATLRWRDTLDWRNPFIWPELQAFIRRDFRHGTSSLAARANQLAFRGAIRLAKVARRLGSRVTSKSGA